MNNNHKVIQFLLKLMMLYDKQGLDLCGHDSIAWSDQDRKTLSTEGNLVALVRFCMETEIVLAEHLAKAPQSAQIENRLK